MKSHGSIGWALFFALQGTALPVFAQPSSCFAQHEQQKTRPSNGSEPANARTRVAPNSEWTLLPTPSIRLIAASESHSDQKQAAQLVKSFASIKQPYYGLSGDVIGVAFSPIPTRDISSNFGFDRPILTAEESFRNLVRMGPRAMPWLLQSLDDKTLTNLVITHEGAWGALLFVPHLQTNPCNLRESASVARHIPGSYHERSEAAMYAMDVVEWPRSYQVRVGDVCLVAIGEVTNRLYSAVRPQPSAMQIITTPVDDKRIALVLRELWDSRDCEQQLLDWLLMDFSTRGPGSGGVQSGAALRLLFYFPNQAAPVIAQRLRELDVTAADPATTPTNDGIKPAELIRAVAWATQPQIKMELLRIFQFTTMPEVLLNALPGVDGSHSQMAFDRLRGFIQARGKELFGPAGCGPELVTAFALKFPARVESIAELGGPDYNVPVRVAICQALGTMRRPGTLKFLVSLLSDRRPTEQLYRTAKANEMAALPIRVCDEASRAIASAVPECQFHLEGSYEQLNRQILVIKNDLAQMRP